MRLPSFSDIMLQVNQFNEKENDRMKYLKVTKQTEKIKIDSHEGHLFHELNFEILKTGT